MTQSDPTSRPRLLTALGVAALAVATAVTIALPTTATADPVPPPPAPTTAAPAPAAAPPADPNAPPAPPAAPVPAPAAPPADPAAPPAAPAPAPAPAPADPNAPPAPAPNPGPADPNAPAPAPAPDPGRITNASGGFSYVLPPGWEVADASRLSYGQALLLKPTGPASVPGQQTATSTETSILLGRLDMKLFAGAEQDNMKAAVRLASDMGEFFMPFPGTRINQATTPLQAGDLPGYAASYDVKFTETAKPNGQIWAGVVGNGVPRNAGRWFVVWLGTSNEAIDVAAAKDLAQSIRPYAPPPPPPAPEPDPNAPAPPPDGSRVGVPVPVTTPVPGMTPGT